MLAGSRRGSTKANSALKVRLRGSVRAPETPFRYRHGYRVAPARAARCAEFVHPRSLRSDLVLHRLDLVPVSLGDAAIFAQFKATDEATGAGLA
jgi:hypothetical protein